ncbi:MAG: hypothetical protein HC896_00585, partial [Bacteroidales bacterium]|nr:hypothetical protein [Bacteroidales bacterium]
MVWQRIMSLSLGITSWSITLILSVYMAGMAVGSWWFGKRADVVKSPLKLYALLEIGIGAFALLFPFFNQAMLAGFNGLNVGYATLNVVRFSVAFTVLMVPTTLMGGTFPVMSRFFYNQSIKGRYWHRCTLRHQRNWCCGWYFYGGIYIGALAGQQQFN